MQTSRKIAVLVGVLFIIATGAAVVQFPLISATNAPDYLVQITADNSLMVTALLCELLMIAAVVAIPVVIYPVLKQHCQHLARGYLVARIFEAIPLAISAAGFLLLFVLSREYVAAGAPDAPHFETLGALFRAEWDLWMLIGGQLVFCLTALILNVGLYRARLVPRLISIWGLIGVPLMFTGAILVLYGVIGETSTAQTLLMLPLAVQEMVFALWLIIRGFSPTAAATS